MDYVKYFGLNDRPFKNQAEGGFFYYSRSVSSAFQAIKDAVTPWIRLKSESGLGKTAFLKRLPLELRNPYKTILLLNPHFTLPEILRQALNDLGHSHKFNQDTPEEELLGYFQNSVSDFIEDGFKIIIAVDNAHELSPQSMAEFYSLVKLEPLWHGQTSLLLCGSSQKQWPSGPWETYQHMDLCLLPLDAGEVEQYVLQRVRAASGTDQLFKRSACRALWEESGGSGELVNQLAERALIASWSARRKDVTPAQVRVAKSSLDNPLTLNTDALRRNYSSKKSISPGKESRRRKSYRPAFIFLVVVIIVAAGIWKVKGSQNDGAVIAPVGQLEAALQESSEGQEFIADPHETMTSTPAATNNTAGASGILAPSLPSPPGQLLNLPQGSSVLVIDQNTNIGRLWQGTFKGAGMKAEITTPPIKKSGLYLFGRPLGKSNLVFQFPPSKDVPAEAAKTLWPQVVTLLPQNILPIIVSSPQDMAQPKNEAVQAIISDKIKAWVQSQEYRFTETTASLYAPSFQFFEVGFQPRKISRESFRAALQSEASSSGDVKLTVSQPLIMQDPTQSNIVWGMFNLKYDSKLRKAMGIRVLVFEKSRLSQDNWLIVAELWLPEKSLLNQ